MIGVLSLIFWALILVVTLKYVLILLRADNNGEGGTLSLMALAQRVLGGEHGARSRSRHLGAALFYGDAMITPAISVLSAVEGLKLVTPALDHYVLPIAVVILIALFLVQSRGTASVAASSGRSRSSGSSSWRLGLVHIADDPGRPAALNPAYAVGFLSTTASSASSCSARCSWPSPAPRRSTPTSAISAEGRSRSPGYARVPGAGAQLSRPGRASCSHNPEAIENPFFLHDPGMGAAAVVILATVATIIASQAVITGAFSLTRQAIQLGLLPRLEIRHTSEAAGRADLHAAGQHAAA